MASKLDVEGETDPSPPMMERSESGDSLGGGDKSISPISIDRSGDVGAAFPLRKAALS